MAKSFHLKYQIPFEGLVWRIVPDVDNNFVLIEIRQEKTKTVSFISLNITSGKMVLLESPALSLDWWSGISSVISGKAILHRYPQTDVPEPMGMYVFDLQSGKNDWFADLNILYRSEDNYLISYRNERSGRTWQKISLITGKIVEDRLDESNLLTDVISEVKEHPKLQYPVQYLEGSEHFITVVDYLNTEFGIKPVKSIDYLEKEGYIIVSFYIFADSDSLNNHLWVLDSESGDIVLKQLLTQNTKGVGLDTFFVFNDLIFCIKNKTELSVYEQ